jgi:hypothetical protein
LCPGEPTVTVMNQMRGNSRQALQIVSLAAVFALVAALPAFAQSPTLNGYTGIGGESQTQIDQTEIAPGATPNDTAVGGVSANSNSPSGGSGPAAGSSGSLPFTGLDLLFISTAGIALLLAGLGLRRATRRRQDQAL